MLKTMVTYSPGVRRVTINPGNVNISYARPALLKVTETGPMAGYPVPLTKAVRKSEYERGSVSQSETETGISQGGWCRDTSNRGLNIN